MKLVLCLFLIWPLISLAQSQNSSDSPPEVQENLSPPLPPRRQSPNNVSLHVSPLSTWIPMKFGLSAGHSLDERWTLEAEYTSGRLSADFHSIDFGKVTDRRYGFQARWYPETQSFHWLLGIFKSEFSAELGNTILSRMSSAPSSTVLKFEAIGPLLGFGNRWQWSNGLTLGVDWFTVYIPVSQTEDDSVLKSISNSSDRSDLDKLTGLLRDLPQFDLFKINAGFSF